MVPNRSEFSPGNEAPSSHCCLVAVSSWNSKIDGLYVMKNKSEKFRANFANTSAYNNCIHLWHRRLGHTSFKVIKKMSEFAEGKNIDCSVCKMTKSALWVEGVRKLKYHFSWFMQT